MSEREYHIDVCPECKVREEDSSEKKLYQCQYCERWFCERHLEPRLAVIRDLKTTIKDVAWRDMVEEEWRRKDGHPDYAYTWERLNEVKIEKELIRAKINAFLDKSRVYRKPTLRETEKEGREYLGARESFVCPKCGSKRVMSTAMREEFEAFECLSCHHTWKEWKSDTSKTQKVYVTPISAETNIETRTVKTRESASRNLKRFWHYFQVSPNLIKIGLVIFAILFLEYFFIRAYFNTTVYIFVALGAIYLVYKLFIIASRIQVTSDLRLWGLRILSGLTFLVGVLLLAGALMSYVFSALTPEKLDNPAYMSVFVFFGVFGLGLMLLSSYLMFRFMLRSGVIVYPR
jgi:ribosomal protein L37AE/L43A